MSKSLERHQVAAKIHSNGMPLEIEADASVDSFMGLLYSKRHFTLKLENKYEEQRSVNQPTFKNDLKDLEKEMSADLKRQSVRLTGRRDIEFAVQITEQFDGDGMIYKIAVVHDAHKKITNDFVQNIISEVAISNTAISQN